MKTSLLSIIFVLAFTSCTKSEEKRQRVEQERQRIEQREKELERLAEEASIPKEPEYEEVTTYYFTSNTEKVAVECYQEGRITSCGVNYNDCKDNTEYACQTGVKEWFKTDKKLVTQ